MKAALVVVRGTDMGRREEPELRQRAKNNVEDDLHLLLDIATKRAQHTNKRLRYLGECEVRILNELLAKLERIS